MSRERRREIVDRQHPALSTVRQCALLDISRSSLYYRRKGTSPEDLAVMEAIDQQYLATPFYGSRRMRVWLQKQGRRASRKNVQHLMRTMGLAAIYRRPRTSNPAPGHKVYPYLLGGMDITRPNQVWAADITYIPMARGLLYLAAIMDWYSRYVVAWNLSNTLDAQFCVEALEEALEKGRPDVFNTDQGSQNQHGRERAPQRRHLRGEAVADGEVRERLPEGIHRRQAGQGQSCRLLSLLQHPTATSGPWLQNTGRGVQRRLSTIIRTHRRRGRHKGTDGFDLGYLR